MKNSNTSFTYSTEFNISTTGNRKENRYWENYIDFSLEKGIQFCSRDYAEGQLTSRNMLTLIDMPSELKDKVRDAVISMLDESGEIYTPDKWIGSTLDFNLSVPCNVTGEQATTDATLINIVALPDNPEETESVEYMAKIKDSHNHTFFVEPNCVQVSKEKIQKILSHMGLLELIEVLEECHFGIGTNSIFLHIHAILRNTHFATKRYAGAAMSPALSYPPLIAYAAPPWSANCDYRIWGTLK